MRLIDVDKLKIYRCDDSASRPTFDYVYEDDLEDAPTIDIIRCEECKYQYMCGHQINRHGLTLKLNCCEYGKRRTDEHTD